MTLSNVSTVERRECRSIVGLHSHTQDHLIFLIHLYVWCTLTEVVEMTYLNFAVQSITIRYT